MRALYGGFGLACWMGLALVLAAGCGGQPDPAGDPMDTLPVQEGAFGTSLTIGDLEAHIIPQLVTSPDPPGRGIGYQKFQDRREVVNSVTVQVPVNEPASLNIRYYIESRQVWTYHDMPVVTRSRIFVEEQDPFTEETYRTLLKTHEAVHGERLPVDESHGLTFDFMEYRGQFGDIVTIIAETEVLFTEPGTPVALVDPILTVAPRNARTQVRSNPMRIEFESRLVPPVRPLILLPEDEELADEDAAAEEEADAGDDGRGNGDTAPDDGT